MKKLAQLHLKPFYALSLYLLEDGFRPDHVSDDLIPDFVSSRLIGCSSEALHLTCAYLSFSFLDDCPRLGLRPQGWSECCADDGFDGWMR